MSLPFSNGNSTVLEWERGCCYCCRERKGKGKERKGKGNVEAVQGSLDVLILSFESLPSLLFLLSLYNFLIFSRSVTWMEVEDASVKCML